MISLKTFQTLALWATTSLHGMSPTHLCAYVILLAIWLNASSLRDGFLVALRCFFNNLAKRQYHIKGVCSVNALQCCVQLMCNVNQYGVHAGGEKTLLMLNHRATIQANTPLASATCFLNFCGTACSRFSAPVSLDAAVFSATFPVMTPRVTQMLQDIEAWGCEGLTPQQCVVV